MERWLTYYPPQQVHIIDGESLKIDPIEVMGEVQRFLKLTPVIDYNEHIRFDTKKGFFCQITNGNHTKCLGKSKGAQYAPMEDKSLKVLQR